MYHEAAQVEPDCKLKHPQNLTGDTMLDLSSRMPIRSHGFPALRCKAPQDVFLKVKTRGKGSRMVKGSSRAGRCDAQAP